MLLIRIFKLYTKFLNFDLGVDSRFSSVMFQYIVHIHSQIISNISDEFVNNIIRYLIPFVRSFAAILVISKI